MILTRLARTFGHIIATIASLGILSLVGYLVYNEVNKSESYIDYTTNSPIEGNNVNETKCYNNGEEVDCDTLNSMGEDILYSPNNLNDNANNANNANNDNNANDANVANVGGSYGVDQDETYKMLNQDQSNNKLPNECYPKDVLSPEELLPTDNNSVWAQSVPAGQGSLGDQNFLNAGFHVGMNTVGQTLRNPNYQLRSEPPNPQLKVSPWLQSTIEPDTNRKPLEIGQ